LLAIMLLNKREKAARKVADGLPASDESRDALGSVLAVEPKAVREPETVILAEVFRTPVEVDGSVKALVLRPKIARLKSVREIERARRGREEGNRREPAQSLRQFSGIDD
jgi:hypothetical protein